MSEKSIPGLRRRISDFCRQRAATVLPPRDQARFHVYVLGLVDELQRPPRRGAGTDWTAIARDSGIDPDQLRQARHVLQPGLDAIDRAMKVLPPPRVRVRAHRTDETSPPAPPSRSNRREPQRSRPSELRQVLVAEHPEPPSGLPRTPKTLEEALDLHMKRFGDNAKQLVSAVVADQEVFDAGTLRSWRRGDKVPRSVDSLEVLRRIETRYSLGSGYFADFMADPSRSSIGHDLPGMSPAERRRFAWHLPDDFNQRSVQEREAILEWVRTVIISGTTDYRRYQAAASKTPFGLRFPGLGKGDLNPTARSRPSDGGRLLLAPPGLQAEMKRLVGFKTATLTPLGYQRSGVWGMETASQKIEHFSLMFGALAADSSGPVRGCDVPRDQLTMGLLIFPQIWDWYVQWRAERRGFYTTWEAEMLNVGVALARKDSGWLRQSPDLAKNITPVPGLISAEDIEKARSDWEAACERVYVHALARSKEIMRVSRVHRDPFEPILPILESDSPVGEYRKIADEVLRLMPDERRFPRATAEAVRAYLLIRLGLHLGLRQKNLRQLLVCPRGERPRSERALEDLKCGELRWSERDQGWEVLVPAVAFKNAHSSFFGKKPYRLVLPDLEGLYDLIEAWIVRHRPILLGQARDPQTFFVKTVKTTSADAAYNQTTFYEAWRLTIQRYGIYNPYTGRGAIEGLLPHGPHNVRDVLATHILKKTGSYEQASYAIQDTPETVAAHYGRFLPQDKAALAAQILNQVWLAA